MYREYDSPNGTALGLGGFPLVSLKEAREKAFANRKLARDGAIPCRRS